VAQQKTFGWLYLKKSDPSLPTLHIKLLAETGLLAVPASRRGDLLHPETASSPRLKGDVFALNALAMVFHSSFFVQNGS
jgi:hypothetical protein